MAQTYSPSLVREQEPVSPPPRRGVFPLADRLFAWAARGAALLTLASARGHPVLAAGRRMARHRALRVRLPHQRVWDPVGNEFGGLVA